MALINCPDCGKEVSDKAPACIHCGFPLTSVDDTKTDEKKHLKFCENCKNHFFPNFDDDCQVTECSVCGNKLLDTDLSYEEYKKLPKTKRCIKCKRNYPKIFIKCPKCHNQLIKKNKNQQSQVSHVTSQNKTENADKTPKCPTCGSTNISKISTGKKVVGFAMVGVFSSNFGKTMECKKCGYKW